METAADIAMQHMAEQLAAAEVVMAGGNSSIQTLRLPPAAVASACRFALAGVVAQQEQVGSNGASEQQQGDSDGALKQQQGVLSGPLKQHEGALQRVDALRQQQSEPAADPPRLLGIRCRRYEAVTHIDGMAPAAAVFAGETHAHSERSVRSSSMIGHSTGNRVGSNDSGGNSTSTLVYGFRASHFSVWDEAAEAEVARVACGGARRAAAADVAAADDMALCFVRDARLWLYRQARQCVGLDKQSKTSVL
jgi:hypothetical protein